MNTGLAFLGGLGLGACLMYTFDPEKGRTRRALARDKAKGTLHDVQGTVASKSRHLRNKAKGLAAEARSTFTRSEEAGEGASL